MWAGLENVHVAEVLTWGCLTNVTYKERSVDVNAQSHNLSVRVAKKVSFSKCHHDVGSCPKGF